MTIKEKNEKSLLILAAGMGSRFGGLKQVEPVDKNGNFIVDYSIFDAIRAGFNKVVFVIRKANYELFKSTIGSRIANYINVEYAFQENDIFVNRVVEDRVKPWGTAHAVLCAKEKINGDFLIINADDFYGLESFSTAFKFMVDNEDENTYANIVYNLGNTLTENGAVKRGVCFSKNGCVDRIMECSVEKVNNEIVVSPLSGEKEFIADVNQPVSMNFLCLNSSFFEYLQNEFDEFVNSCKDPLKDECLIQEVMLNKAKKGSAVVKAIKSNAVWHGVTYKEDKPALVNSINELIEKGEYPHSLWRK